MRRLALVLPLLAGCATVGPPASSPYTATYYRLTFYDGQTAEASHLIADSLTVAWVPRGMPRSDPSLRRSRADVVAVRVCEPFSRPRTVGQATLGGALVGGGVGLLFGVALDNELNASEWSKWFAFPISFVGFGFAGAALGGAAGTAEGAREPAEPRCVPHALPG